MARQQTFYLDDDSFPQNTGLSPPQQDSTTKLSGWTPPVVTIGSPRQSMPPRHTLPLPARNRKEAQRMYDTINADLKILYQRSNELMLAPESHSWLGINEIIEIERIKKEISKSIEVARTAYKERNAQAYATGEFASMQRKRRPCTHLTTNWIKETHALTTTLPELHNLVEDVNNLTREHQTFAQSAHFVNPMPRNVAGAVAGTYHALPAMACLRRSKYQAVEVMLRALHDRQDHRTEHESAFIANAHAIEEKKREFGPVATTLIQSRPHRKNLDLADHDDLPKIPQTHAHTPLHA